MTAKSKPAIKSVNQPGTIKWVVAVLLIVWSVLIISKTTQAFNLHPAIFDLFFNLKRFGPIDRGLFFSHWLGTIKIVLLLVGMLLTAFGLGSFLAKKLGLITARNTPLQLIVTSLALGFAGMSFISLCLGVMQLYYSRLFLVITIIGALGGSYQLWRQKEELKLFHQWSWKSVALLDFVLLAIIMATLLFSMISANTPEIFFDSLVYHLAVPYHHLMHHGIQPVPTIFFSNMPFGMELLYSWSLAVSDERLCRMIHVVLGSLTSLLVYITARRFCRPRYAFWAAALYLLIPVVLMNMMHAGADVGATLFCLLGFNGLLDWVSKSTGESEPVNSKNVLVTGLMIGLALFFKYTTAFILAPAVAISFLLYWLNKKYTLQQLIKMLIMMTVGVLITLSPLFIKNAVFTHNPVYPFLFKVFPSKHIHPEKMQNQMNEFKEFGKRSLTDVLKQPWFLSFYQATSNSFIGAIFIFLMPMLLVMGWINRRGPPMWQLLFWSAVLGSLIWTTQTQIIRYYMPIMPMLCILSAISLERMTDWNKLVSVIAKMMVLFLGLWCTLLYMGIEIGNQDNSGVALGLESRENYLNRKLMNTYFQTAQAVNQLPDSSKVLIYGDSRSYYYKKNVTVSSVFDHHPLMTMWENKLPAEQMWLSLKEQGYTHILFMHGEAARVRGYEPYNWDGFAVNQYQKLIALYLKPIHIYRQQVLYEIVEEPISHAVVKTGRPLFLQSFDRVSKVQSILAYTRGAKGPWQSISIWKQVSSQVPQWWVPYQVMAWYYYQLKDYAKAVELYTKAESLGWLDEKGYFILANEVAQRGRIYLAKEYFEAALLQAPEFKEARQGLEQVERLLHENSKVK